jgi:hypothetical protein
MTNLVIGYWIVTTIITIGWFIKQPIGGLEDKDHFTLFDVFGNLFPAVLLGWVMVPVMILSLIKFKR